MKFFAEFEGAVKCLITELEKYLLENGVKSGFESRGINSAKLKLKFIKSGSSLGESHTRLKKI